MPLDPSELERALQYLENAIATVRYSLRLPFVNTERTVWGARSLLKVADAMLQEFGFSKISEGGEQ